MRVKQVTGNPEAFAAWIRYVKALVARYRDVVDEWEIWNEPFNQRGEYAEMVYATAKAVHEVQPAAKCFVTAISWNDDPAKNDYRTVAKFVCGNDPVFAVWFSGERRRDGRNRDGIKERPALRTGFRCFAG